MSDTGRHMHLPILLMTLLLALPASAGLSAPAPQANPMAASERGREIWLTHTYGGERFFAFLAEHPDPTKRLAVGFAQVVTTPRPARFERWGTLNDPDCRANPAGGPDLCPDPHATGVIGIRQVPGPDGQPLYGVACAGCHAGFDPLHPPADPSEPTWANIHPTIGNQYLRAGAIFAANLDPTDPRRLMFDAWPAGTVDTTLLFSDYILNPSVITQIWELPHRPTFEVGLDEPKPRNGRGGEDDLGLDLGALRVYTNLGVCFFECVAPALETQTPLDLASCRQRCADLPPQQDLDDLAEFLATVKRPPFPHPQQDEKSALYARGREVFDQHCGACHDNRDGRKRVLSNDEVNPLAADPGNAPHACRALTTNWEAGHLWANFSSEGYKARAASDLKGYRTIALGGVWATTPFLHNQSVGDCAPATASPAERAGYYRAAMEELLRADRAPKILTLPVEVGPLPAGTPLQYVFSRDPDTGELLCDDIVENRGHHYGADLPVEDKEALIYWLQRQ
jgi:mono/diheme cytochrome c family protein